LPGRGRPGEPGGSSGQGGRGKGTSWEHVAAWYDKLTGDGGSDYHRHLLIPAALRLLDLKGGQKVLDLCCGQGVLARALAEAGAAQVVGVDLSPALIQAARGRGGSGNLRYVVADARALGPLADGSFDAGACLMAVHDVDDAGALFVNLAAALKPGARAALLMMHPCFRIPRQSHWGWDDQLKTQYRRIDRYASEIAIPIATHPGAKPGEHTMFFHRPLATYLRLLAAAGLAVTGGEELLSHHRSEPGGRSRAENRARDEFPVFLALQLLKLP
jgi:ubiquinone/menaquinone biosynthesis C-methylase UbiE